MIAVQEILGDRVIMEDLVEDAERAVKLAKAWSQSPIRQGDCWRVLWDGEVLWEKHED